MLEKNIIAKYDLNNYLYEQIEYFKNNKKEFCEMLDIENTDDKNIEKKSVCRSGLLDDKTKIFTTTKGEIAFCYFDVDRNNYRTAKNKWTINIRG